MTPDFVARCYTIAAYVVMRCVCVCVSVTFVNSVETNKRIVKNFSPSGSHTILVFPCQTAKQYSDGNSPNVGVECRWGRQKSRFWAYICLLLMLQQARCFQHGRRWTTRPPSRELWHIVGSKRRCWLREKTTKCLWQEASTLRQIQQNSAFNCTQW